jgi:hypothetical protein
MRIPIGWSKIILIGEGGWYWYWLEQEHRQKHKENYRVEQEQCELWTQGVARTRKEYRHQQGVERTGRNMDNYRVSQPKGRKNAEGSLTTKISILNYIQFNNN